MDRIDDQEEAARFYQNKPMDDDRKGLWDMLDNNAYIH